MGNPFQMLGMGDQWDAAVQRKNAGTDYRGPEYTQGVINQQHGSNVADWQMQTGANRPNVQGPYGGQQWSQDPTTGEWKLSSSFSGPMAGANSAAQSEYAGLMNQPLKDIGTGEQARQQAIDSAYGQATSRLDPQWNKREAALQTQLLNQGLDPTSEAGKSAMAEASQQRNDAYTSAMNSAILQGNQAGNDVYRNNLLGRESELETRAAGLQQLGGMQQLLQAPNYNAAGQVQGTDVIGANRDADIYNLGAWDRRDSSSRYMADNAKDTMKYVVDKFMGGVGAGLGGKG